MQITIFSFFMAVVWSSILIIIFYLMRKQYIFLHMFGVASLLLLYIFCALRVLIPFEFPFTKVLSGKKFLNVIYQKIYLDKINNTPISIMMIFLFIWIGGLAILLIRFACQYNKVMKEILAYDLRVDGQCKSVFEKVLNDSKKNIKISIRCNRNICVPMGIGIFKKSILLPNEEYTDLELYYILLHEYTHYMNKDIYVKLLVYIFGCIFWWNPVVYLLRKDLSQVLEMKCDLCITNNMKKDDRVEYLTTIISTLKKTCQNNKAEAFHITTSLAEKKHDIDIIERFSIVTKKGKLWGKNKGLRIVWFMTLLIIMICSYSFVIQPYYDTPIEEIETNINIKEIKPSNASIVKSKDDTYTLIISNGVSYNIDIELALLMKTQGFKIVEEN